MSKEPGEVTVYFDGECAMCRTGVSLLRRVLFLRGTRLTPAQEAPDINEVMRQGNTWVVIDQVGQTRIEFDAFVYLCRRSPVFWPLSYLLRIPPVPHLGLLIYRFIATHRR